MDENHLTLHKADSFVEKISAVIKEALNNITEETMCELLTQHYKKIYFMDAQGRWIDAKLEGVSEKLLPKNLSMEKVFRFIDSVAGYAKQNQYLMNFFSHCNTASFPDLEKKIKEEGNKVLPDVVALTIMLENLTRVCAEDWTLLEFCYEKFKKEREKAKAFQYLPWFHKIKLISVELPFTRYIRYHKTKIVPPTSGGFGVALNIIEAMTTDFFSGNQGNADAGWILTVNKAGSKKFDPATGAGPSGFSPDGKMIERVYPLPEKWADLYQTWNMAFVTRFRDFPYILPKLFIPQVANYHEKPKEYTYNRAIALYIYLNWASFDLAKKIADKEKVIFWFDKKLNREWGIENGKMAKDYKELLKKAKRKTR